jgi:hypothetical protein
MEPYLPDVAKAMAALSAQTHLTILAAGDDATVVDHPSKLPGLASGGGVDASAALVQALDTLAAEPNAAVLWIHGQQPELLTGAEALLQRLERRGRNVPIFAVQLSPGPNRLIEQMDGYVRPGTAFSKPQFNETLAALWRDGQLTPRREKVDSVPADLPAASAHIARLWANESVRDLVRVPQPQRRAQAVELATGYQLVTPVTGAVVLETAAQYAANNLQPVDPTSTPSVPEPGSLAVIALASYALLARRRRSGPSSRVTAA